MYVYLYSRICWASQICGLLPLLRLANFLTFVFSDTASVALHFFSYGSSVTHRTFFLSPSHLFFSLLLYR